MLTIVSLSLPEYVLVIVSTEILGNKRSEDSSQNDDQGGGIQPDRNGYTTMPSNTGRNNGLCNTLAGVTVSRCHGMRPRNQAFQNRKIVSAYQLSPAQCLHHLLALERIGLITLLPGNRIRLRVARDFKWAPGGPVRCVK